MKNTFFYKIIRRVYWFVKSIYHFLLDRLIEVFKNIYHFLLNKFTHKKDQLLFVFGGRAEGWPGIARSLYNDDKNFAATIQYCNRMLTEFGGSEILSYFEEPLNEHYFDDESKVSCIMAIQLATAKLYNDKGIFPNAVMGISLGEVSAAYVAGALTFDEALKLTMRYCEIYKKVDTNYLFLYFKLSLQDALNLCKECPVLIEVVYEDSPQAVLIVCHQKNIEALRVFTDVKQIKFKPVTDKTNVPYHTSLIRPQHELLDFFNEHIEPKPLKCDYYSPVLGKRIAKHTVLSNNYWYDMACEPVLFNTVLQTALDDGYKTILQLGPPAVSERQWKNLRPTAKLQVFNSFKFNSANETQHIQSEIRSLNKIRFKKTLASSNDQTEILNEILNQLDIHAIDQNERLAYLLKNGEVHYIPLYNGWMVFGYDNTDYILKNPTIFSSSPYDFVDHVLMGADPEAHKIIRGVLQPLFSAQTIAEIGKNTLTIADNLLDSLLEHDQFDLAKDFSDPLSQKVLCGFMGFTPAEEQEVITVLGRDYHNSNFFERLGAHFNNFNLDGHANEANFLGKTYEAMQCGQLTQADAASLLRIILTAGIATTSTLISTILNSFHKNPQLAEQIRGNDQLIAKYIEECLRLETPAHYVRRTTTQPIEISGKLLPANSLIYINLRSANRDPDHFPDPAKFSITRPAKRNLVFGSGIHQCIGMGISRAGARSTIQSSLARLPQLLAYKWGEPEYYKDSEVQAMTTLILTK